MCIVESHITSYAEVIQLILRQRISHEISYDTHTPRVHESEQDEEIWNRFTSKMELQLLDEIRTMCIRCDIPAHAHPHAVYTEWKPFTIEQQQLTRDGMLNRTVLASMYTSRLKEWIHTSSHINMPSSPQSETNVAPTPTPTPTPTISVAAQ